MVPRRVCQTRPRLQAERLPWCTPVCCMHTGPYLGSGAPDSSADPRKSLAEAASLHQLEHVRRSCCHGVSCCQSTWLSSSSAPELAEVLLLMRLAPCQLHAGACSAPGKDGTSDTLLGVPKAAAVKLLQGQQCLLRGLLWPVLEAQAQCQRCKCSGMHETLLSMPPSKVRIASGLHAGRTNRAKLVELAPSAAGVAMRLACHFGRTADQAGSSHPGALACR